MSFDKNSKKAIKKVVERLKDLGDEARNEYESKASVAYSVIEQNFPGLDDDVLAAISYAIGYVAAEIAILPVQDAGEALVSIYLSYHLAAARFLKLYDAKDAPSVKVEKDKATPTAPMMTGGYL